MSTFGFEVIEQTDKVIRIIAKLQCLRRIVARAIAAPIPYHRAKMIAEMFKLSIPIRAIAADTMQKNDKRAAAFLFISKRDWSSSTMDGVHTHSLRKM